MKLQPMADYPSPATADFSADVAQLVAHVEHDNAQLTAAHWKHLARAGATAVAHGPPDRTSVEAVPTAAPHSCREASC